MTYEYEFRPDETFDCWSPVAEDDVKHLLDSGFQVRRRQVSDWESLLPSGA